MPAFFQQNRTILLAFFACAAAAMGIFVLIYLDLASSRPVSFRRVDVAPLPHDLPARVELASDASLDVPTEAPPPYAVRRSLSLTDVRSFWDLPAPTRVLSEGKILLWQTERAGVNVNLERGELDYTNNAPAYPAAPLLSLEDAAAFGEAYLKKLPLLERAQITYLSRAFIKIHDAHEEPGEAASWDDADVVSFSYARLIQGLPVITAENPAGALYTLLVDKRGEVLSVNALVFDIVPAPQASAVSVPLQEARAAIQAGMVTFVELSDEAARIDLRSMDGKTVTVNSIGMNYLLNQKEALLQPVYVIKGSFDYRGKEVETIALYPATVSQ